LRVRLQSFLPAKGLAMGAKLVIFFFSFMFDLSVSLSLPISVSLSAAGNQQAKVGGGEW